MEHTACLKTVWEHIEIPVFAFPAGQEAEHPVYCNRAAAGILRQQGAEEPGFQSLEKDLDLFVLMNQREEAESLRQAIGGQRREDPLFCHIGNQIYSATVFSWEEYCICMLRDMSVYYRENQRMMEDAILANQAKTNFLSEISHDIRTPMNAIIGMTDIALMQPGIPGKVEDCLDKIRTASGHMMSLLNEVLDMSRIESGRVVLVPEALDLADLLHEILIVVRSQADSAKVGFGLEIGRMEEECVLVDGVRLKQICLNLLSNAVKFTPEGGNVHMFWEVRKEADARMVELYVRVEDTGMGMSEEFLKKVFVPFEREQNSTISKIQGTGLGMTITKNLTELMGGSIAVRSTQGQGTCFEVQIPLKPQEAQEDFRKNTLAGARVLLLDGEAPRACKVEQMLEGLDIFTDRAGNAESAVALLNDAEIDGQPYFALLTVEKLPGLEMVLFLQEIRNRFGKRLPILMLSESDWSQTEYLLTSSGVDAFVPMPLFPNRLLEALYRFTKEGIGEKKLDHAREEYDFSGKKLLLVEDNEINREIAMELLGLYGLLIDTAENGQEAVEYFKGTEPLGLDLILMDVQMPVMNGLDATRAIRKLPRPDARKVPIVAMTANAFMEDIQRSLDAGMNAHLSKPLDMEQMRLCLKRFLGR